MTAKSAPSRRNGRILRRPLRLTSNPRSPILRSDVYPTIRSPLVDAGYARRADPAHPDLWPAPWTSDRPRDPGVVTQRTAGRTRRALSGAAAARGEGLDFGEVGDVVEQPPRPVLFPDKEWPGAAGS